jgi:hypothetical protein
MSTPNPIRTYESCRLWIKRGAGVFVATTLVMLVCALWLGAGDTTMAGAASLTAGSTTISSPVVLLTAPISVTLNVVTRNWGGNTLDIESKVNVSGAVTRTPTGYLSVSRAGSGRVLCRIPVRQALKTFNVCRYTTYAMFFTSPKFLVSYSGDKYFAAVRTSVQFVDAHHYAPKGTVTTTVERGLRVTALQVGREFWLLVHQPAGAPVPTNSWSVRNANTGVVLCSTQGDSYEGVGVADTIPARFGSSATGQYQSCSVLPGLALPAGQLWSFTYAGDSNYPATRTYAIVIPFRA